MDARLLTLVAVVSAAGLLLTLTDDDEPAPESATLKGDTARSSAEIAAGTRFPQNGAEGTRRPPSHGPDRTGQFRGYAENPAGEAGAAPPRAWTSYRFRPLDGTLPGAQQVPDGGPPKDMPPVFYGTEGGPFPQARASPGTGPSYAKDHRFRPLDTSRTTRRYQPYAPSLRAWRAPPSPPGYPPRDMERYDVVEAPEQGAHRFRPLEEGRQPKRWPGNYRRMSVSPAQFAGPHGADPVMPPPG